MDAFHLHNLYDNSRGGFLDVFDITPGNKYGVVSSSYWDRSVGSGTWRMIKARA